MDGRVKSGGIPPRQANWVRDGRSGNELPCACESYTHPSIGAPRGGYGLTLSGQLRGWVGSDAGALQVGSSAAGGIPGPYFATLVSEKSSIHTVPVRSPTQN